MKKILVRVLGASVIAMVMSVGVASTRPVARMKSDDIAPVLQILGANLQTDGVVVIPQGTP